MEITREQGYDSLCRIFGVFNYNRFPLLRFTIPVYDLEPIKHTDTSSIYATQPVQYPNEIDLIEIAQAHNQFVNRKGDSGVLKHVTHPLVAILNKRGGVEFVAHVLAVNEQELRNLEVKKSEWDAFMGFIRTRENGKLVPFIPHPGYIDTNPEREESQRQEYEQAVKEWKRYETNRCKKSHVEAYGNDCEAEQAPMLPAYYLERHQSIVTQLESSIKRGQTTDVSGVIFKYVSKQMERWNQFEGYIREQGRKIAGDKDFNGLKWKEVKDEQHTKLMQELEIRPFSFNSIKGIEQYWKVVKQDDIEQLWLKEGAVKKKAFRFIINSPEAKKTGWTLPAPKLSELFRDNKGKQLYPPKKAHLYRKLKYELCKENS